MGLLGAMKGVRPAGRQAAEPPKPSQSPRSTFLRENEARGGHVLDKHVGKTDEELLARLKSEPGIKAASTFTDEATAEREIMLTLKERNDEITRWVRDSNQALFVLKRDAVTAIGRVIERGSAKAIAKSEMIVVLKRSQNNYYVLTAYVQ